jgi:hypothetical protein
MRPVLVTPFDDFDLEASSILTIFALNGCSRHAQDLVAAELREFVAKRLLNTKGVHQ